MSPLHASRRSARSYTYAPDFVKGLSVALLALLAGCEGDTGPAGPAGGVDPGTDPDPSTATSYDVGEAVPQLLARIEGLRGASGPGGVFQVGDVVTVDFSLRKADGTPWALTELSEGHALLSGPTFNYQRVLPLELDVQERARAESGLFSFTFPSPIPATFAAPYNDTTSFGASFGDLGGQDLIDGTYTVGLSFTWDYDVEGQAFQRVGEVTHDFLLGTGAGDLISRAVTSGEHCNQCHGDMRAHDGRYRNFALCVMCHTAGAEDANLPDVEGGTPDVTISSRVLFHKLHAGRFLPSVNGVSTNNNGSRNYMVEPVPLRYVRANGEVRDFSHVGFPVMPNRLFPMPRDTGYNLLSPEAQAAEDRMRSMTTQCVVCHGDPDGDGPIEEPAQAGLIDSPTRQACGSCHDDVIFTRSYRANGQTMRAQNNDTGCNNCHGTTSGALASRRGHVHPLDRVNANPGIQLGFEAMAEAGQNDGDGTLDPGEGLALEFTLTNDAGEELDPNTLDELHFVLSGPTTNFQVLYDAAIPPALVEGLPPYRLVLPERVQLEFLGDASIGTDVFQTERIPHRLAEGSPTQVLVRSGTSGGAGTLLAPASRHDRSIVVDDGTGFDPGDVVVLDDGQAGLEEYWIVRLVEGSRLWISAPEQRGTAPGLRNAHASGASVLEVQLFALESPAHYTLDATTGQITEGVDFGIGNAVLASYTTDWRLPAEYPQAVNGSAALDDQNGKWTGKSIVSGTYGGALAAAMDFEIRVSGTDTPYRASSPGATREILVGDALELDPYRTIADAESCNTCHQRLSYHEGLYRGFDTCILCHGASGNEDLPRAVAANAPETPGRSVEFRTLLHKIHRGNELADESYQVVGDGPGIDPDPDNFIVRAYHNTATLPAFPGRTLECARCHGEGNSEALLPAPRRHPTEQVRTMQIWRPACATCHDSEAAVAHIDSNTAQNGGEACAICHDPGEFEDAGLAHRALLEPR